LQLFIRGDVFSIDVKKGTSVEKGKGYYITKKIIRFSHFHHVLMLIIPTSIFTIMMLKLDHVSRPGSPIGGKMLSSSMISSDLFEAKLNLKNINLFNKYHLSHGCM